MHHFYRRQPPASLWSSATWHDDDRGASLDGCPRAGEPPRDVAVAIFRRDSHSISRDLAAQWPPAGWCFAVVRVCLSRPCSRRASPFTSRSGEATARERTFPCLPNMSDDHPVITASIASTLRCDAVRCGACAPLEFRNAISTARAVRPTAGVHLRDPSNQTAGSAGVPCSFRLDSCAFLPRRRALYRSCGRFVPSCVPAFVRRCSCLPCLECCRSLPT